MEIKKLSLKSAKNIEKCIWDETGVLVLFGTEDGFLQCSDVRKLSLDYIFSTKIHAKEINSMSINPAIPSLLSTFSADGFIKLWDISGSEPQIVSLKHGKVVF